MSNARTCLHPQLARPLCYRYELARFFDVNAAVLSVVGAVQWNWGFGIFAEGEFEVLGAWPKPAFTPRQITDDLAERGVDRIKTICCEDAHRWPERFADLVPIGAPIGPHALRIDSYVCPAAIPTHFSGRKRRVLLAATTAAGRLNVGLARALCRRAPFTSKETASTFIARWLERVDRSLKDPSPAIHRTRAPLRAPWSSGALRASTR